MYTVHRNVQIILALLKKYDVKHLVLSAGTRHIPLVFSAEDDKFFKCYSIVDERSAGFFALGLIQTLNEPVAIVCTSGTAACNYVSAVTEAFYQHLPLVVLTSDRNQIYLNQQEDQCIPQMGLYQGVLKAQVNLPIVRDEKDFWYCGRLVNEALLELDHGEKGPVHINFPVDDNYPIEWGTFKFDEKSLPDVKKIDRVTAYDDDIVWYSLAEQLTKKRVLLVYGQSLSLSVEEKNNLNAFCAKYNVVIASDHIGNVHVPQRVKHTVLFSMLSGAEWDEIKPDIVITMNGSMVMNIKSTIRKYASSIEHWHVSPDGKVSDPYFCQKKIVEAPVSYFFRRMAAESTENKNTYWPQWKAMEEKYIVNDVYQCAVDYSAVYAVKELLKAIPDNSLLHISNSNNIRITNMFPIKDTVDVYCNRGTCGIDGSMSSYIAQSYITNKPSFMLIGDLSFFYDMNALWNRYCTKNTRIMLCNNGGGALFHSNFYKTVQTFDTMDVHIAAGHETSAKGWAETRGFTYLSAHDKAEYDRALLAFIGKAEKPILLEVFTDKDVDIRQMGIATNSVKSESAAQMYKMAAALPDPLKRTIKSIIRKK